MFRYQSIDVTGKTVAEVVALGAPEDATFDYAGCGTHEVLLAWRVPLTPEEEEARRAANAEADRRYREKESKRLARKGLDVDETKVGF